MCEPKPGTRCSSDTRGAAATRAEAYAHACPHGPSVDTLEHATVIAQSQLSAPEPHTMSNSAMAAEMNELSRALPETPGYGEEWPAEDRPFDPNETDAVPLPLRGTSREGRTLLFYRELARRGRPLKEAQMEALRERYGVNSNPRAWREGDSAPPSAPTGTAAPHDVDERRHDGRPFNLTDSDKRRHHTRFGSETDEQWRARTKAFRTERDAALATSGYLDSDAVHRMLRKHDLIPLDLRPPTQRKPDADRRPARGSAPKANARGDNRSANEVSGWVNPITGRFRPVPGSPDLARFNGARSDTGERLTRGDKGYYLR